MKGLFARQPLAWTSREHEGPRLRRTLGWPALTAIGLGTMLGGIFPTIGAGAHAAGPGVILAYVLSGLVSLCVALCYAEFASMVPVAGSAYTYAYATLGEVVAWVIGWDLILEYGLSVAPTASSWSAYAQQLLGSVGITLPAWAQTGSILSGQIDVVAALVVIGITVLVAIGIRESANVNGALVVFQIVTMLVFIGATFHAVHAAYLRPFAPHGFHGILASTALVFYAYIGFDTVTVASEEANDPVRHVPVGIILALIIGALLYVALTFFTVAALPYQKLSGGAAMLDALKAATTNPVLFWIVALGGVAGNTTVAVTSLLGQIRIFYVMARDRMLPPGVAKIHPRFRTPARMTLITGGIVAVLAATLPLSDLLDFVNIGTLSAFAIVCAGVLVLRVVQPDAHRPFRVPFVWLFTIGGALSCLLLITGLSLPTWIRFALWFAIGIAIYAVYGYRKSRLRTPLPP
ncbi:MAG TPA: amino acid permease [Candidatus Baltobacteraceae bacterium]|nr:amino acid permease [Candidatus Baltobacteraceae bacterium]